MTKDSVEMMVVKATESDLVTIAKIHRMSREEAMPWLPNIHTPEEDYWFFSKIVFPQEVMWVALIDAKVVGFISIKDDWLNHLYVSSEHWRKNVGVALLTKAKSAADCLQLWTFQETDPLEDSTARTVLRNAKPRTGSEMRRKHPIYG